MRQKNVYLKVKSMVALVDDIAATALQSMVRKLTLCCDSDLMPIAR